MKLSYTLDNLFSHLRTQIYQKFCALHSTVWAPGMSNFYLKHNIALIARLPCVPDRLSGGTLSHSRTRNEWSDNLNFLNFNNCHVKFVLFCLRRLFVHFVFPKTIGKFQTFKNSKHFINLFINIQQVFCYFLKMFIL